MGMMTLLLLWLSMMAVFLPNVADGFGSNVTPSRTQQTQLRMVSNIDSSVSLPRDVKDAVSRCKTATQEALKSQISRMDIEFPVGTKFGVEKYPKNKSSSDGGPTQAVLNQSDRELARLFVDMFQPVGGENIVVAFTDQTLADAAKKKWKGDPTASSRILAMNRKKGSAKTKKVKAKGFAAKLAAEIDDSPDTGPFALPDGTQVAIFVSPGPKELPVIEKICNQVGMETCVILLNARLSKISNFGTETAATLFNEEFKSVFALTAAPQDVAPNCLLYHAYPTSWTLARKPKVGQPKPILTQNTRPTDEECEAAFNSLELTDLEKGVENALENVAGWTAQADSDSGHRPTDEECEAAFNRLELTDLEKGVENALENVAGMDP
eukprot:scaffold73_cov118-Cylindrotheca_fusiformis.AAC.1